jgi:hypothetical protein
VDDAGERHRSCRTGRAVYERQPRREEVRRDDLDLAARPKKMRASSS